MWDHLVRVGIDNIAGYLTGIEGLPTFTPKLIQPEEFARSGPGSAADLVTALARQHLAALASLNRAADVS
jgi:hypothetical protein